jgi:simple sugar transport system permease protein
MRRRRFQAFLRPAGALAAALAAGALLISLAGANPARVYLAIASGALGDRYHIAETVVRAIPLALVALGAAVPLRAGVFSIGAEGQMAMGALAATATVLALSSAPGPLLLVGGLVGGALGGALWALVPGLARARAGVNEILSTLLLNYVAGFVLTLLLKGALRNPASVATPQSPDLPAAALIPRALAATRLHWGFLAVLAAALLLAWWVRTPRGFAFDVFGLRPDLARRMGASPTQAIVLSMVVAGAAAGVAGWLQVAGVQGRLYTSVAGGIGFNGVVVAVLGGLGAPGILVAAFFFAALATGAEGVQAQLGVPSAIATVIQAVLLLAAALTLAARRRSIRLTPPRVAAESAPQSLTQAANAYWGGIDAY